mgnify:CR=1 FL=1
MLTCSHCANNFARQSAVPSASISTSRQSESTNEHMDGRAQERESTDEHAHVSPLQVEETWMDGPRNVEVDVTSLQPAGARPGMLATKSAIQQQVRHEHKYHILEVRA